MTALNLIWVVSLFLASISLTILSGLMFVRMVTTILDDRRRRQREAIVPLFLGGAELDPGDARKLPPDLVTDVALQLIHMVRGEDRDKFVEKATAMGVEEHLRQRLESGGARMRLAAAEALEAFRDPRSVDQLLTALDDPNQDVRLTAALSLASSGNAPPIRDLIGRLSVGTEEGSLLVVSLFRVLLEAQEPQIRALLTDPSVAPGVRAAAVEALATQGDYSLVPIISELALDARDDDASLPQYLRALGTLGHPAAERAVIDGLGRSNAWVRIAAARAAGSIGLTSCIPLLVQLLSDSEWWVRFRAGEALIKLGEDGRQQIALQARIGKPLAREAARTLLAELAPQ